MTDINVYSTTQQIHVDPASSSVAVINAGPPGPPAPSEWVTLVKLGTWTDEAGHTTQIRKVGDIVYLRGSLKPGATPPAFTIPVGFRPPTTARISLNSFNGSTSVYAAGSGIAYTNGSFEIYGHTVHANSFVMLNGILWSLTA